MHDGVPFAMAFWYSFPSEYYPHIRRGGGFKSLSMSGEFLHPHSPPIQSTLLTHNPPILPIRCISMDKQQHTYYVDDKAIKNQVERFVSHSVINITFV